MRLMKHSAFIDVLQCQFAEVGMSTVENIRKFGEIAENWVFILRVDDTVPA